MIAIWQNEKCESEATGEDGPKEVEETVEQPPSPDVKKTQLVTAARVRDTTHNICEFMLGKPVIFRFLI